jgi:hypothetical protein
MDNGGIGMTKELGRILVGIKKKIGTNWISAFEKCDTVQKIQEKANGFGIDLTDNDAESLREFLCTFSATELSEMELSEIAGGGNSGDPVIPPINRQ